MTSDRGLLPGSVGRAYDSGSQLHEFKTHIGCKPYLKKKRKMISSDYCIMLYIATQSTLLTFIYVFTVLYTLCMCIHMNVHVYIHVCMCIYMYLMQMIYV